MEGHMLNKISGLARALAVILSVVTVFVTIPNLDVTTLLIILGLLAGFAYSEETSTRLILAVLALPMISGVLGQLPTVGSHLATITGNIGLAVTGAAATLLTIRIANLVKGDLTGLGAK
jgi:hypothetical protein